MAKYTWRVPKHELPYIRSILEDAAEATRLRQHARLRAAQERMRAHPNFPLGVGDGDQIEVETIAPVVSYSANAMAQHQRRVWRAN
jgi:hypothetical protein